MDYTNMYENTMLHPVYLEELSCYLYKEIFYQMEATHVVHL